MPVSYAAIRDLAITLPGVIECDAEGGRALVVGEATIARLRRDGLTLALAVPLPERDRLLREQSEAFFVPEPCRAYPVVIARLEAATLDSIAPLIRRAWFAGAGSTRRRRTVRRLG